jgi:hypothetical protein
MPGPSSILNLKSLVNMRFLSIAVACLLAFSLSTSASPILEIVDHDQTTYEPLMRFTKWLGGLDGINRTISNNLVLYTKYSPAVYQWICRPLENILLKWVCFFFCLVQDNALTCALSLGMLVRTVSLCAMTTGKKLLLPSEEHLNLVWTFSSVRKMGTLLLDRNLKFQNTDVQIAMSLLQTTGVVDVGDSYVHSGFLLAYNTAALTVLDTINAQVAAYPSYQIVVVGHSLGGAVASIAALSIKAAVPNAPLKLFTYGRLTSSTRELLKLTIV